VIGRAVGSQVHRSRFSDRNPTSGLGGRPPTPVYAATIVRPVPGLLLLRHAQSVWNATGRWQGTADPPLSEEGERQTQRAAARVTGTGSGSGTFDLVVSSDLQRARRTAELLALHLGLAAPHWIEAGLREYDVGEWSGLTHEQIESRWPGAIERFARGELSRLPGGEDRAAFDARVVAAGQRVGRRAGAVGADRVLVVVHGGVVRSLARAAGQTEYRVGPLAGYWGSHTEGGLFPTECVDLLADEVVDDAGEGSIAPAV
jgi:broad specificity phosphatase PhoE